MESVFTFLSLLSYLAVAIEAFMQQEDFVHVVYGADALNDG
jgi:hypothetical protein